MKNARRFLNEPAAEKMSTELAKGDFAFVIASEAVFTCILDEANPVRCSGFILGKSGAREIATRALIPADESDSARLSDLLVDSREAEATRVAAARRNLAACHSGHRIFTGLPQHQSPYQRPVPIVGFIVETQGERARCHTLDDTQQWLVRCRPVDPATQAKLIEHWRDTVRQGVERMRVLNEHLLTISTRRVERMQTERETWFN